MNIDTSAVISLFTGESGFSFEAADVGLDGLSTEQFAAALSAQIAALNKAQDMQRTMGESGNEANFPPLFAALHGKNLPGLNLNKGDIDLDATLQALTKVLQNIDAAQEAGAESVMDSESAQWVSKPGESGEPVELLNDLEAEDNSGIRPPDQSDVMPVMVMPTLVSAGAEQNPMADFSSSDGSESNEKVTARSTLRPEQPIPQQIMASARDEADTEVLKSLRQELDNPADMSANVLTSDVLDKPSGSTFQSLSSFDGNQTAGPLTDPVSPKAMMDIGGLNRALSGVVKNELPAMMLPLAHPDWGNELAEKMVWMHKQSVPSAELNLNPRHLGPIAIHVDVNQEQTSITFTTHHSAVKEAIEASLPRLRELLGTQQLNLVDVNVSQQHSEQKQGGNLFQAGSGQQGRQALDPDQDAEPRSTPAASVTDEIEAGRALVSRGILSIFA